MFCFSPQGSSTIKGIGNRIRTQQEKEWNLNGEWNGFEGCCWRQKKNVLEQSGYEQDHVLPRTRKTLVILS